MKKYYYVCPRCGHRWSYFWKRKEMHCSFCGQDWNTDENRYKKLRGSYFSWTSFFWTLVAIALLGYLGLRVADKMGYVSAQKLMTLLERQRAAQSERLAEEDDENGDPAAVVDQSEPGISESEDAPPFPERAPTPPVESKTVDQIPLGRVRERKPSENSSEKTLEAIITEAESESAASENSDKDWDF